MATPLRVMCAIAYMLAGSLPAKTASASVGTWMTAGPPGVDLVAVAISAATPTLRYAVTDGGDLYKSVDAGTTWSSVGSNLPMMVTPPHLIAGRVFALSIDPVKPATLYAGASFVDTGGYGVFPYLYKSTDAGTTWTGLPTSAPAPLALLAIDRVNPQVLYASAGPTSGVPALKSTDGGESWTALDFPGHPSAVSDLEIDPVTSTTVYAVARYLGSVAGEDVTAVVYRSTDGGTTWTSLGVPSPSVLFTTIDPATPTTVYAAGSGIYRSTDGGKTWAQSDVGLSDSAVSALVVDPAAPSTLYAGTRGHGVFRSTDAGASWTAFADGMTGLPVSALAIDPAIGTTLYAATPGSDDCCTPARLFELTTCASARCTIGAGLTSAACIGQRIPPGVRRRFERAVALVDRRNHPSRRRLRSAAKVLKRAAAMVTRGPRRERQRITRRCSATLAAAAEEVTATLGR
jgi:photosystem II stability/assembly factor-like uncharacterized protein